MHPQGKLLVIEELLPPGTEPSFGKGLGLHMHVMLGGRERTAPRRLPYYRALQFVQMADAFLQQVGQAAPCCMERRVLADTHCTHLQDNCSTVSRAST